MKSSTKEHADIFLELSVYLTGFSKGDLLGTGMLEIYLNTIKASKIHSQILKTFFAEAEKILSQKDTEKILSSIKLNLIPDQAYEGLAKNIITMWYMSTWGGDIISAESYKQGLVWETAEAHPPGAKQPGYGTWSEPPLHVV